MRSWGTAPLAKIEWAGGLLAASLAVTPLPSVAEQDGTPTPFWRNEEIANPSAPRLPRPHVRPPIQTPTKASAPLSRPASARATPASPAFVVTVFGDAFASQLARGLSEATANTPGTLVDDRTRDDMKLSAADPTVWAAAIDDARAHTGRLDVALILVGGNEHAPFTNGLGESQPPGSPAWRELYGQRVEQLAHLFREKRIPLIWVGLPIVRDADEAKILADRNAIIREKAPKGGALFVDAWEAFADENGQYSATGPDVSGQTATLRRKDGWNFTHAGARKLAGFVEADIKRERDRVAASNALAAVPNSLPETFDQALSIDINAQIRREAGLPVGPGDGTLRTGEVPAKSTAGPVLTLTAPPLSAGGALARFDRSEPAEPSSSRRLDDVLPGSRSGRTDDFTWPGRL